MSRLPHEPPSDPEVQSMLAAADSVGFGNVIRAIAHHPGAPAAVGQLAMIGYLALPPQRRELAYLTASKVNTCHYWVPTHTLLGRSAGLTDQQIAHLHDDPLPSGVYSEEEAVIIRYAQTLTRMDPIDDDLYSELTRHFETSEIFQLCFTVGLSNLVNRFHATFLTDVDPSTIAALD